MSPPIPDEETRQDAAEEALLVELSALLGGDPVYLEEHDEEPDEWGVWAGAGDDAELVGSGYDRIDALEDAIDQAKVWKANRRPALSPDLEVRVSPPIPAEPEEPKRIGFLSMPLSNQELLEKALAHDLGDLECRLTEAISKAYSRANEYTGEAGIEFAEKERSNIARLERALEALKRSMKR